MVTRTGSESTHYTESEKWKKKLCEEWVRGQTQNLLWHARPVIEWMVNRSGSGEPLVPLRALGDIELVSRSTRRWCTSCDTAGWFWKHLLEGVIMIMKSLIFVPTYHNQPLQLPCTLKVRPLAVFLSFSSFSGRALRSTLEVSKSISRRFEIFYLPCRKSAVRRRILEWIYAWNWSVKHMKARNYNLP